MTEEVNKSDIKNSGDEIPYDIENALDRALDDYSSKWKGLIGESIQNSYDGWLTNKYETGVIEEDSKLEIKFEIDVSGRRVVITDNAGGMTSEVFFDNFAGLNTPSKYKESGKSAR